MDFSASYSRREMLVAGASAVACAALAAGALSGCSQSGAGGGSGTSKGALRVGVRSDIVGFSSYNAYNNKYYGLEIDLAEELASRMGYSGCEYTQVTPDTRKETLAAGSVDCIIACYSVSESREQNFDFSPAYYEDSVVCMVEKSTLISNVSALKGCTFGTVSGANTAPQLAQYLVDIGFSDGKKLSANADNTEAAFDTWKLRQLESYQALSDALEQGTVDAFVADGAIASAYADADRIKLSDFSINPQHYAVATNKDSSLSQPVSDAMQAMIDDGTVARLIQKWS